MAQIGRNRTFQIYHENGTPYEGLVLHKCVYDSVVMSLGDKITGELYYRGTDLALTMKEYIEMDDVKFSLVSPPTIVREGLVKDNGGMNGMTKYSFTFYHPMYMLGNFPFSDVAVTESEERYLSQNKAFSWIGKLQDYVDKLNANLDGTEWIVTLNGNDPLTQENGDKMSDVLTFDKESVAEALKKAYDTWEVPYTIGSTNAYGSTKKFVIEFGTPSNEIYEEGSSTPFVFRFGKDVGLKNKSRTPKNNKIITRIAACGSEDNIPYGYPQIRWWGDQSATETQDGYPIYDGIVNGAYVKLIKHPFTRTTLMPSIYVERVFNKVSPYLERQLPSGALVPNPDYDNDLEIIDYYDAYSPVYPNPINLLSPSYEHHQFDKIKPRLSEDYGIVNAVPVNFKETDATRISGDQLVQILTSSVPPSDPMYKPLRAMYGGYIGGYPATGSSTGGAHTYEYALTYNEDHSACDCWLTSDTISFKYYVTIRVTPEEDVEWDDTMNDDGEYVQSYFKVTLPQLDFDLYACASITQEMELNMRSGACLGCTFPIYVDWEDYKKNFYDENGNFAPSGSRRDYTKYPKSDEGQISVIVHKDNETFGRLMPNKFQEPLEGDKFVILGISLPESYITNAQEELDEAMMQYMLENNVHYFEYPLKFSEKFLAEHTYILSQIHGNSIVHFEYDGVNHPLAVKQLTIKYETGVLPQYDISLTDDLDIVLNQIGVVTDDVSRLRLQLSELQAYYGTNVTAEIEQKLSRVVDDVANGHITFQQGLTSVGDALFRGTLKSPDFIEGLYTGRGWRIDNLGNGELESITVRSFLKVVELIINRLQAQEGDTLFTDNDQVDAVEEKTYGSTTYYVLTLKEKWEGYVTGQKVGNIIKGIINTLAAQYGRVSDVTESQCVEEDGDNKYYTSWMRQIDPSLVGETLATNQIAVVLYSDSEVPAQKNFPPCELMIIARWGCIDAPSDASAAVKADVKRRQTIFSISVSDGRISKLRKVNSPMLAEHNFGTTLGLVPDFIQQWSIADRLREDRDYLYAQGVIVGDFIKVDINGDPIINYVDRGEWADNTTYLVGEYNPTSLQWETHDVWHNGAMWRCLQHQPVTVGGTSVYYEPSDDSVYWQKLLSSGTSVTITSNVIKYAASDSGTTHPASASSAWQTTIPQVANGLYLWTWTHVEYSNNTSSDAYSVSRMGIDGRGIQSSTVTYSQQQNPTDPASITNWGSFPATLTQGYWLYTKTHIVYSDGSPTDSYSVSQIGVGAYYAGTQEWYARSNSSTTPPTGYPDDADHPYDPDTGIATYVNGEDIEDYIGSAWSQSRPQLTAEFPYLWNFEVSYDSRGNKYVTRPICIGNFAKGIVSIVETYAISAYDTAGTGRDYPADISPEGWSDEAHDAVPTDAKPYQWNSTLVRYNDGSEDTHYHISAVKGTRGDNGNDSIILDLDNENANMLYKTDLSTYLGSKPLSTWNLYEGGVDITSRVTRNSTNVTFTSTGCTASWTNTTSGSATAYRTIQIDSMTAQQGQVVISVTYGGHTYSKRMNVTRVVGIDAYELVVDPSAITTNTTTGTSSSASVKVLVYKTDSQDGTRTLVTSLPSNVFLYVNPISPTGGESVSKITTYSSGYTFTASTAMASYHIVLTSTSSYSPTQTSGILDSETIPISKSANGQRGDNGEDGVGFTASPNVVLIDATSTGRSTRVQSQRVDLTMYVGGSVATITNIVVDSKPSSASAVPTIGTNSAYLTIGVTNNVEAMYYEGIVTFTVTATFAGETYTMQYSVAIVASKQGLTGEKGSIGRNFYYDGEWSSSEEYELTSIEAPFVTYNNAYWVRVGEDGSTCRGQAPSSSSTYWEIMTTDFKYLISEAIFSEFAKLGSAIFNKDWMISQYGIRNNVASSNYSNFTPQFPNSEEHELTTMPIMNITQTSTSPRKVVDVDLVSGTTYTLRIRGQRTSGSGTLNVYMNDNDGNATLLASFRSHTLSIVTYSYTATRTGKHTIEAWVTSGSGLIEYVRGRSSSPFIPRVAVDWYTGYAHFGSDNVRFNPDGSGHLAGGNIEWNADGTGSLADGNIVWDEDNNLTVNGTIYANSGEFNGVVNASSGTFNGVIKANALYAPFFHITSTLNINPATHGSHWTLFNESTSSILTATLPDPTTYDGMDAVAVMNIWTRIAFGSCRLYYSGNIYYYDPMQDIPLQTVAAYLVPNKILHLTAISGRWFILNGSFRESQSTSIITI